MAKPVMRVCRQGDFDEILDVINAAAVAYHGAIPDDCWHEPYMSAEELENEIDTGVNFHCASLGGKIIGVMGIQDVRDTTLIRHAYVIKKHQGKGVGGLLLGRLLGLAKTRDVLVGTWAAATWAVRFYEKHGFRLVGLKEKDRLLREYWMIADRQIETSVVLRLADSAASGEV